MSASYIPPGYWLLRDRVKDIDDDLELRDKLANGELKAYYFYEDGRKGSIARSEWRSKNGEAMLDCGYWAPDFHKYKDGWGSLKSSRDDDNAIMIEKKAEVAKAPVQPVEPAKDAEPLVVAEGGYLSPFLIMMIEGTRHFEIQPGKSPKKEEIEEYFQSQKLPNGTPISASMARMMATFIRPPEAMKGGQKKMG